MNIIVWLGFLLKFLFLALLLMLVMLFIIISIVVIISRVKSKKIKDKGNELGTIVTMNATYGLQSAFNRTLSAVISSKKRDSKIVVIDRLRDESTYRDKTFEFEGVKVDLHSISIVQGKGIKKITSQFAFSIALFKELRSIIFDIDTIYSFDLDTGIIVYLFTFMCPHISFYYHIADFYADSRLSSAPQVIRKLAAYAERKVMKRSTQAFICVEYRDAQVGNYIYNNMDVIHNSPVLENEGIIRMNPNFDTSLPIKIGYVGTLRENRFLIEAIDAISSIDNVELHIAGVGKIADIIESKENKDKGIYYYGQMKYEDTFEFYKSCDVILSVYDPHIKNHKYSAPNKFYEAMLLGKSIIVAKDTGVDSLVSKHEIGYVIDYSEKSFVELLNHLTSSEGQKELSIFKERSYDTYDKYSWEVQKNKIVSLINGGLNGKI